tara:strand:- start:219 stop:446 length:228 start_codon:yes stop_codon:yes gene_type:complete
MIMVIFGIIIQILLGAVYVDRRIPMFSWHGMGLLLLLIVWWSLFIPEDFGWTYSIIMVALSIVINFLYRKKIEKL